MPNVFGVGSRNPLRRWYCVEPPRSWYCLNEPTLESAARAATLIKAPAKRKKRLGETPGQTITSAGVAYPLYDPRLVRDLRARFRRDMIPKLRYANSLYVPGGRYPARGWILLRKLDYDQIAKNGGLYGTNFFLNMDEFDPAAPQQFAFNLVVVQAQCCTTGIANDPDAIYLVEITDLRGILNAPWFRQGTNTYYNVRSPGYPGEYYLNSLNGVTPWTWSEMIEDLWLQMPLLGTFPGLPITPTGTPENWKFPGVSLWNALNDVLEHLGLTIAVDLISTTSPYSIVQSGAADATFSSLAARYSGRVEDDAAWIDVGSGRVPGTVVVLFHRRNEYYGTEETIRNDALQWETTPLYSVSVNAPAQFTGAAGTHYLWDDFQVRYDINGDPVVSDILTANAIAAERSQQFYNDIYNGTLGYMRRLYTGVIPFATGSQVDGVCWRMDFNQPRDRTGWCTEIVRQRPKPWPEVLDAR